MTEELTYEIPGVERYKPENPLNYSEEELAVKKKALEAISKDYPKLPLQWIEMVYDFHKIHGDSELSRILHEGEFDGRSVHSSKP